MMGEIDTTLAFALSCPNKEHEHRGEWWQINMALPTIITLVCTYPCVWFSCYVAAVCSVGMDHSCGPLLLPFACLNSKVSSTTQLVNPNQLKINLTTKYMISLNLTKDSKKKNIDGAIYPTKLVMLLTW